MSAESVISEHIVITPGKPRIANHRIKVQDVVIWHEEMGLSPQEIVNRYSMLTLADVHSALAYYYDHQEMIQQHIKEDGALAEALENSIPSKMPPGA
jgi:uncharacterized protein (DUF433 family)